MNQLKSQCLAKSFFVKEKEYICEIKIKSFNKKDSSVQLPICSLAAASFKDLAHFYLEWVAFAETAVLASDKLVLAPRRRPHGAPGGVAVA